MIYVLLADLLNDGLPVIDFLEILSDLDAVSLRLDRHQSGISRIYRKVSKNLSLNFNKHSDGFYGSTNNLEVLHCLRHASQLLRLKTPNQLRWSSGLWNSWAFTGNSFLPRHLNRLWFSELRTVELIRSRILDLAFVNTLDLAPFLQKNRAEPQDYDEFVVIKLCSYPLFLTASPSHPLANLAVVSKIDLRYFPSLATPDNFFPFRSQLLKNLGLWSSSRLLHKYSWRQWEAACLDNKTLIYTTPVSDVFLDGKIKTTQIQFDLAIDDGDALLIRKDVYDHFKMKELVASISRIYLEACAKQFAKNKSVDLISCSPALKSYS